MDSREPSRMDSMENPGMMVGQNSYGSRVPSSSMATSMVPGMQLSFNQMLPSAPKPDSAGPMYDNVPGMRQSSMLNMGEPMKKKRGRPRKYGTDNMVLALSPISSSPLGYSTPNSGPMSDTTVKRRGRPPGSGKKQQLDALGSAGIAFTPHVITVKAGEDIASKIMAFSQQGPRTVCILSANGAICNVTLRQPATSGGTVTYEGRYEIMSLSGSFLLTENGGTRSRTGGLSVALAGSDGRVLGGSVAGMLKAASPVQVVMGSFIAEGKKPKPDAMKREPSSVPSHQVSGFGAASASSPPSQGTDSDSDAGDPGSPSMNQSIGGGNNNNLGQHFNTIPAYHSVSGWPQHRHDSDL
ncbi:AT-hook motif nuclear-localized protein 10-like [Iris pallida]|uniref:AT-hook motif nuclear-localized protein n=1 Tax=Iris pallida TaxID=29817 RepID=A0AAX6G1P4_IRIPA|nr:AT-hook motif nuclear-localized protein 10-like [Iris pallida]KAJ6822442.1 AT-hook motif nuclear-localized protein 10-like [Iris pallida]